MTQTTAERVRSALLRALGTGETLKYYFFDGVHPATGMKIDDVLAELGNQAEDIAPDRNLHAERAKAVSAPFGTEVISVWWSVPTQAAPRAEDYRPLSADEETDAPVLEVIRLRHTLTAEVESTVPIETARNGLLDAMYEILDVDTLDFETKVKAKGAGNTYIIKVSADV